jgi:SAM-dependent methyltransferase
VFNTTEQTHEDVLIAPTLDERNRQAFAKHLRQFVFGPVRGAAAQAFQQRVAPANATAAKDRKAAREALLAEPEYQFFSDLHRVSQELIWNSVSDTLDRASEGLKAQFRALGAVAANGRACRGSLSLDASVAVPKYLLAMDTHCMPGSYHTEWSDDDLANGALYDRGAFLYAPSGGPRGDGAGRASLEHYRRLNPHAKPRRILDLGCATAGPLLPIAAAFPDAELHGLDIGAPLLRFAHLRAEQLGVPIHFRQADAACTGYPDAHFDLIVSHIMFHETSAAAAPAIVAEAHRILAPGGVFLFVDLPNPAFIPDVFQQVVFDGDAHYNNEHFWMRMHDLDWPGIYSRAGFAPERVQLGMAPIPMYVPPSSANPDGPGQWVPGRFGFFAVHATK